MSEAHAAQRLERIITLESAVAEVRPAEEKVPVVFDPKTFRITRLTAGSVFDTASLENDFRQLVDKWNDETAHLSVDRQRINATFHRILVLGPAALPLILKEFQQEPDSAWLFALRAFAYPTDPAQDTANYEESVQKWLEWGRENDYIQ